MGARPRIAKITKPVLAGVCARPRLFRLVDAASRRHPIVWIGAPAGSGKTTLAASYLDARRRRCLWYQLDARDADPAAFFYYLREAARRLSPRRRETLPLLTPEYALGLDAYCRNFFEELGERLPDGAWLVLDNVHELPERAPLHELLPIGLAALPPDTRVLVLSRAAPAPSFARHVAAGAVAFVDAEELNLTEQETGALARARTGAAVRAGAAGALLDKTRGWMAGTVLLLEAPDRVLPPLRAGGTTGEQVLFEYFAAELFDRADPEVQRLLLSIAILPEVDVQQAEALAGEPRAGTILADLIRRNFFTLRLAGPTPRYRLHPLFREFLLSRAREALPARELAASHVVAARLLAEAGQEEDAIELLRTTAAWEEMAALVLDQAERMLAAGRGRSLARWITSLPEDTVERNPWLSCWLGLALLPSDPPQSRRALERALARFEEVGDASGAYLAWSAGTESFIWEWADFTGIDVWLTRFDRLRDRHPDLPGPEIAARVALTMYSALMLHRPDHAAAKEWEERAIAIALGSAPPPLRIAAGTYVAVCTGWFKGELRRIGPVIDAIAPLARSPGLDPHAVIMWCSGEAPYHWSAGATDDARRVTREGLALAEATGIRVWDFVLQLQLVFVALAADDRAAAARSLAAMRTMLDPARHINVGSFELAAAMLALRSGELEEAVRRARRSHEVFEESGYPFGLLHAALTLSRALLGRGALEESEACLRAARRRASAAGSTYFEYGAGLIEALILLRRGEPAAAIASVGRCLALGARENQVGCPWLSPADLAELCAVALEHGVEAEHALALVGKLGLVRPESAAALAAWPIPVRIDALGTFDVWRGPQRVAFGRKVPRRTIELLQALVALGGREVRDETLADLLWPDAEGDAARQALETALHRVRRLLGRPDAIVVQGRRVSLDPLVCWVDVLAMREALSRSTRRLEAGAIVDAAIHREAEQIANLYRGPLLGGVENFPLVGPARERIRSDLARYFRALERRDPGGDRGWSAQLRALCERDPALALHAAATGDRALSG